MFQRFIGVLSIIILWPIDLVADEPTEAEAIRAVSEVYAALPRMLNITWREGPEYPLGIQDSAFAVIDSQIVSAGGFSRFPKEVLDKYPDTFEGESSGFTKVSFLFDSVKPAIGWTRIADVPGPPRQAAAAAVVGSDIYVIGGFNYSEPHTYTATYRLRRTGDQWKWETLNCELPWPICEAGVAVIGDQIYLVGGADYHTSPAAPDGAFGSESGRNGESVGRGMLVLNTKQLNKGWRRLADTPGSPRCFTSCAAAGGKVYLLGGLHFAINAFHNVVDSWVYDPRSEQWSRLTDMPHGGNRRVVAYNDRYLIMLGGHRYGTTWNVDGTVSEAHTPEEKALGEMKHHIEPTVLVFDTRTNRIGTADPLLDKSSWPMATIRGNTIYCLGGEGGNRLWHPATFQIGKIKVIQERN